MWLALLLFAVSGSVAMISENGLRHELLEIIQHVKSGVHTIRDGTPPTSTGKPVVSGNAAEPVIESRNRLTPLPTPSAEGVIFLKEKGPYAASTVTFAGNLTIRGTTGTKPEIQIDRDPLSLTAQSIKLEQVMIRSTAETTAHFLVKAYCQELNVASCEFLANLDETTESQKIAALAWKPFERDAKSGQIAVKNTVFHGNGPAILMAQSARQVRVSNSLKTGRGEFVSLGSKCLAAGIRLELDHVTLRETGPLLALTGEFASKTGVPPFQIEATDCVFSLAEPKSGFIVIDSETPRSDAQKSVEMTATNSVIAPGTALALLVTFDSTRKKTHDEDASDQFQGLVYNDITFAGENLHRTADSRTAGLKGPRNAGTTPLPGIDLRQLSSPNRGSDIK